MKILIPCEVTQIVTTEFRKLGHEAYSCDIKKTTGDHPEWHLQQDVTPLLLERWDMIIAFPPCTDIAVSGSRHFPKKIADGRQQKGIDFFMKCVNANSDKISIENPVCIMSTLYKTPSQIIQPFYFGDPEQKTTCLWLKNLPKLEHYPQDDMFNKKTWVEPEFITSSNGNKYTKTHWFGGGKGAERSETFPGIAKAMAKQWSR